MFVWVDLESVLWALFVFCSGLGELGDDAVITSGVSSNYTGQQRAE